MAATAGFPDQHYATDNPDLALELLDAAESATSLRAYTHLVWPIIEPGRQLVYGWHMDAIGEHLEAVTAGEIRRLVVNVPPGFSKAAEVSTPILTTWGWRRHGDIRPGHYVFGPDGRPKLVEGITLRVREESYRVTFDDKAAVIVSAGHLWQIGRDGFDRAGKRVRHPMVVETRDLVAGERGDCTEVCEPVQLGPKRLLIDPYLLGAWLGDGDSNGGTVYVGDQDIGTLGELGRIATTIQPGGARKQAFHHVRVEGLRTRLRVLGLLLNKHIPADYLEASEEQRWELLRGLMDTDGHCGPGGVPTFTNTNERLARDVVGLACSLGLKVRIQRHASWLNGKRYRDSFRVTFTLRPGQIAFKLRRKQERVRFTETARSRRRYVKSVEAVGPQEVSCLHVEGKLYLIGRELLVTHNSLETNVIWPSWEWGPRDMPFLRYLSFAYAQSLTIRDNLRCRRLINSPLYQRLWGSRFGLVSDQNAKIRYDTDQAGFRQASSVGGTGTGERADRVVLDDPDNVSASRSEKITDATLQWLSEVVPSRLTDLRTSAIILIQQRTRVNDCTGHVLKNELGYDWLCLPMEHERSRPCYTPVRRPGVKPQRVRLLKLEEESVPRWIPAKKKPAGLVSSLGPVRTLTSQDRRTREGEMLDPDRFPRENVDADLKRPLQAIGGSAAVEGQLQQRPQPPGGTMFKRSNIKIIDAADVPKGLQPARGYDLAGSKTNTSSWSASVKIGVDFREDDVYILDVDRIREESGAVVKWMQDQAKADGKGVQIDFPQDPAQAGKWQKGFLGGKLAGYSLFSSTESGSKEDRAQPLASQCELGNLYLVRAAWNDAWIAEAVNFPRGDYKDQIDAAARAYARALKRSRRAPPSEGPKVIT